MRAVFLVALLLVSCGGDKPDPAKSFQVKGKHVTVNATSKGADVGELEVAVRLAVEMLETPKKKD